MTREPCPHNSCKVFSSPKPRVRLLVHPVCTWPLLKSGGPDFLASPTALWGLESSCASIIRKKWKWDSFRHLLRFLHLTSTWVVGRLSLVRDTEQSWVWQDQCLCYAPFQVPWLHPRSRPSANISLWLWFWIRLLNQELEAPPHSQGAALVQSEGNMILVVKKTWVQKSGYPISWVWLMCSLCKWLGA